MDESARQSLLLLVGLSALITLLVTWKFHRGLRRLRWTDRSTDQDAMSPSCDDAGTTTLSVVVPARNEAGDLARTIESLLAQQGVSLEIVVVNDHSQDATGSIADQFAARDPRVRVVHNPPLPAGWLGKCNAMQHGVEVARGEWFLFTDADVVHSPLSCRLALAHAARSRLDMLSFVPLIELVTLWEHALLPMLIGGIAQLSDSTIDDPREGNTFGVGAFMLIRRPALEGIGGMAPIRMEMLDDVELARVIKRAGCRVAVVAAPDLVRVRLFKNGTQAFWGTTKNILGELKGRLWLAFPVAVIPLIVFESPLAAASLGVWAGDMRLTLAGLACLVLQYAILFPGRALYRFGSLLALAFPLVGMVILACVGRAMYYLVVQGSVHWRGRLVKVRK